MNTSWHHGRRVATLLLSAGIITFGCDNVLNIDQYSTNGCPAPGTKQCFDNTLKVCLVNGQWQAERECSILCATDRCIDCVPGTLECDQTTNSLKTCGSDRLWSYEECRGQTCVVDHCQGICAPGQRCTDTLHVESCVDGQWVQSVTCSQVAQCIGGECRECIDGEARCNESTVETCLKSKWLFAKDCSAAGEWGSVCVTPACDGTCAGVCSGDCAATCTGECAAGRSRCSENVSETCSSDGYWQRTDCSMLYQTCNLETGLCAGECASTSMPICEGNILKSCSTDGQWVYEDCGSTRSCVVNQCVSSCGPTSARCSGNQVEVCGAEGTWTAVSTCAGSCADGMCVRSTCDCGPNQNRDCCAAPFVPGGTFQRGNASTAHASISPFRLDAYEITVGRFRKFVSMYDPTSIPEGAGANPNVPGSGWKAEWIALLAPDKISLTTNLTCHPSSTWTNIPNANEERPLNCLSWYEAFAFCIWDGGFLPTEAEWNFAAAGGSEQREYPWSIPATSKAIDLEHAVFQCLQTGSFDYNDCFLAQLPNGGSRSPTGDGKWGHKDLAGSLFEWTLDYFDRIYPGGNDCQDCARLTTSMSSDRVLRGGGWNGTTSMLYTHARAQSSPAQRQWFVGARCARGL